MKIVKTLLQVACFATIVYLIQTQRYSVTQRVLMALCLGALFGALIPQVEFYSCAHGEFPDPPPCSGSHPEFPQPSAGGCGCSNRIDTAQVFADPENSQGLAWVL